MNATVFYHIAAALFVIFAAGHTFGVLLLSPKTRDGLVLRDAMHSTLLVPGRPRFTYGGVYRGFGLYITIYLLFAAFFSWHLAGLAATDPQAIGALGPAFLAVQVVGLFLSLRYFSPPPVVMSILVVACLGAAVWLTP